MNLFEGRKSKKRYCKVYILTLSKYKLCTKIEKLIYNLYILHITYYILHIININNIVIILYQHTL